MTNGALVMVWGQAVRGREQHALVVFNEVLGYFGRLQRAGEIDSFEPVALEPSGGTLAGFLLARGDPAQLQRIRLSDEFLRLSNRSLHVVDHFGVHGAHLGDDLQRLYANWGAQAQALTSTLADAGSAPAYLPT